MTTLEANRVTYLVIACTARDRYFDLDAVRTPHQSDDWDRMSRGGYEIRDGQHGEERNSTSNPAGAPPLDWFQKPADELSLLLCKAMLPRRVCRVCGEPSRRIMSERHHDEEGQELAAHIRERREALGITREEVNGWFGYVPRNMNWESGGTGFRWPNANDWAVLKERLGLSDRFDEFIDGDRTWTESQIEYRHISDSPSGLTQSPTGELYHRLSATKARVAPLVFTDCGHGNYRSGVVLDPFLRTEDSDMPATFIVGDALTELHRMPDNSVDLVMTSPPFLALRSYLPADHPDKQKEIGSEATPGEYLDVLLDVVVECRRVLAPHGSLVVELGDTYAGGGQGPDAKHAGSERPVAASHGKGWPLAKSLTGIPELFMLSLTYGRNLLTGRELEPWRVRNFCPWVRPNPPVGALGDKFRPATSYLTVACTTRDRWFDLDAVRHEPITGDRVINQVRENHGNWDDPKSLRAYRKSGLGFNHPAGAPPLDWFNIPTAPYKGAHYATYPPDLIIPFIKSMCPQRVCRVCGEPSRRIVSERHHDKERLELATHIRERREALGISREDVNAWFGFVPENTNWESLGSGGCWPPADKWPTLKERLGLSDEFDALVLGEHRWTESTIDYVVGDVSLERDEREKDYGRGGHSHPNQVHANRNAPDTWTDCGHILSECRCGIDSDPANGPCEHKWRPGVVLDPFAGSGTTLQVATGHGRDAIGIDLDPRNAELAIQRCGMFLTVEDHEHYEPPPAETVDPKSGVDAYGGGTNRVGI